VGTDHKRHEDHEGVWILSYRKFLVLFAVLGLKTSASYMLGKHSLHKGTLPSVLESVK
jgi:hypothetical protein